MEIAMTMLAGLLLAAAARAQALAAAPAHNEKPDERKAEPPDKSG